MTLEAPPRVDVLGLPISLTTFDETLQSLRSKRPDRATVIAVCNVHSVMTARRDPRVAQAVKDADVATPDGMPLVWALRLLGHEQSERVYGPEILRRALLIPDLRHFFYGSTPETLAALEANSRKLNPTVQIVGAYAPPFRDLPDEEEQAVIKLIMTARPDVVWVGLGMPKQELWMHRMRTRLPGMTLAGVGAAFDFVAETKKQAPSWMQQAGLEWLYRLTSEPRRLWRRYLWNNPVYLLLLAGQVLRGIRSRVASSRRSLAVARRRRGRP